MSAVLQSLGSRMKAEYSKSPTFNEFHPESVFISPIKLGYLPN